MTYSLLHSFHGHSSIKEIEQTYGHILNDYKKKKLEDPCFKYKKEDIITSEILQLAKEKYKNALTLKLH